jgi:hypothetical protein
MDEIVVSTGMNPGLGRHLGAAVSLFDKCGFKGLNDLSHGDSDSFDIVSAEVKQVRVFHIDGAFKNPAGQPRCWRAEGVESENSTLTGTENWSLLTNFIKMCQAQ